MTAAVAVVRAWRKALNARDLERMLALAHSEIEIISAGGSEHGLQPVREFMARQTYGIGLYLEHPQLFADGDTVVLAARSELRWVHTGELADTSDVAALYRVLDDRITRIELYDELRPALAAAALTDAHRVTDEP